MSRFPIVILIAAGSLGPGVAWTGEAGPSFDCGKV